MKLNIPYMTHFPPSPYYIAVAVAMTRSHIHTCLDVVLKHMMFTGSGTILVAELA